MPSLVRPTVVSYTLAGRRVPPGTPGAKKVRTKAAKWYGQGVPGYPPKKRIPLAADKAVARRMLAEIVARIERGQAGMPDPDAGRRHLGDSLAAFQADLALGLATRAKRKRRPDPDQVRLTVRRVRAVLDGCGFAAAADLNETAPAKLAKYLTTRADLPRREGGVSHQTAAFYLAAARRFVWWLSVKSRCPVRPDLFDDVPGFDAANNRVHSRRDCSAEELARVLEAARADDRSGRRGPLRQSLPGPDRYFVYLVGFSTGYRAEELSHLTPSSFDLDADPPVVVLPGRFTKNKKPARQPLPPGVAAQLRDYLAGKDAASPVWPGLWWKHAARMLRKDLAAAGVPYSAETPDGPGVLDFHALRHSFLSALAAAGVGPKELQILARHSDPRLTLGVYTHVRPESLGASVARMQIPGSDVGPIARMSRADLETAVIGLAAVVATLTSGAVTPRLAHVVQSATDSAVPARTAG